MAIFLDLIGTLDGFKIEAERTKKLIAELDGVLATIQTATETPTKLKKDVESLISIAVNVEKLLTLTPPLPGPLGKAVRALKTLIKNLMTTIKSSLGPVKDALAKAETSLKKLKLAIKKIRAKLKVLLRLLDELVIPGLDKLLGILAFLETQQPFLEKKLPLEVQQWITQEHNKIKEILKQLKKVNDKLEGTIDAIKPIAESIKEIIEELDKFSTQIQGARKKMESIETKLIWLNKEISKALDKHPIVKFALEKAKRAMDNITIDLGPFGEIDVSAAVDAAIDKALEASGLNKLIKDMGEILKRISKPLKDEANKFAEKCDEVTEKAQEITDEVEDAISKLKELIDKLRVPSPGDAPTLYLFLLILLLLKHCWEFLFPRVIDEIKKLLKKIFGMLGVRKNSNINAELAQLGEHIEILQSKTQQTTSIRAATMEQAQLSIHIETLAQQYALLIPPSRSDRKSPAVLRQAEAKRARLVKKTPKSGPLKEIENAVEAMAQIVANFGGPDLPKSYFIGAEKAIAAANQVLLLSGDTAETIIKEESWTPPKSTPTKSLSPKTPAKKTTLRQAPKKTARKTVSRNSNTIARSAPKKGARKPARPAPAARKTANENIVAKKKPTRKPTSKPVARKKTRKRKS